MQGHGMSRDPYDPNYSDPHPERSKVKMTAAFADEDFVEATEADEAGRPSDEDIASNELHAASDQVCAHCGQPIAAGADVRKTLSGGYVHEMCPPRFART